MSTKTLFRVLKNVFEWIWNINLVLGLAAIIFVSVNAFTGKKVITANYLGSFKIKTEQIGEIHTLNHKSNVFIDDVVGSPSLLIDSKLNVLFIYAYMAFILSIVLFYNYQLMKLFATLEVNITEGTPFGNGISKRFLTLSKISILLCTIGCLLSFLKVVLIQDITFQNLTFYPVFDNRILNLAWISIACFIISGIFKTGCELKQENDLTI